MSIKKRFVGRETTTVGVGGEFDCYLPESIVEASFILRENPELWVMGGGSNLLIPDGGAQDAICLRMLNDRKTEGCILYAESGCLLSTLAKLAMDMGLCGLEFASAIPGTIGGAIHGNAGAFGQDICSLLKRVTLFDGKEITKLSRQNLDYGYRKGIKGVVLSAELELSFGDKTAIEIKSLEYLKYRKNTQPTGRSFGSVFKRYNGISPAVYIEKTGLKGVCRGGAKISEKHCNFILNEKGATSADVLYLVNLIQDKVDVPLEREFIIPPSK